MSDKGQQLVTKGAVKKLLENEYAFDIRLCQCDMFDAIDALEPVKEQPDYKAMIVDLEQDFNGKYAWQLSTRTETLKDILKKVRDRHTPQVKETEGGK